MLKTEKMFEKPPNINAMPPPTDKFGSTRATASPHQCIHTSILADIEKLRER